MEEKESQDTCDIVQDLLPLYHDGVLSDAAKRYVERHLGTCPLCREKQKKLENDEAEQGIKMDVWDALSRHARRERNLALEAGLLIAGLLMLPVIIAILLTLPGYSDWKTDAVLITSLLLVAAMTVVPLCAKKKKTTKTIVFSTLALLLLIFSVQMLFGEGSWLGFAQTAFSVVFGLSLFLAPLVIRQTDLPDLWKNQKALITMIWDSLWLYLMLFVFVIAYPYAIKDLLSISSFFVALAWLIFLTARYLRVNRWAKATIITALAVIWLLIGYRMGWVLTGIN